MVLEITKMLESKCVWKVFVNEMWQNAKLTEYIVPLILITVSFEKKNAKVNCSLCSIIYDYFVYKDK